MSRTKEKQNEIRVVNIRMVREPSLYSETPVSTPQDVMEVIAKEFATYDREVFGILNLKTNGQIINMNVCSVGTLNASMVNGREVFKSAILSNAGSFICFHVHPSGNPEPSEEDIPNETIGTDPPEELPDKDQVLLIYCRSGNRSKDASQKLANMGYTNVYEFGGINTWTGEIVSEQNNGEDAQNAGQTGNNMKLRIDDTEIPVSWEKNVSVSELKSLVKNEPITIQMSMYGDFEQVGPIGQSITSNDKQITAKAGDIVLYSGDQIVIFYGTNSWDYTMLGHVDMAEDELTELLSNGDVKVTIQQNKEMAGQ